MKLDDSSAGGTHWICWLKCEKNGKKKNGIFIALVYQPQLNWAAILVVAFFVQLQKFNQGKSFSVVISDFLFWVKFKTENISKK